MKKMMLSLAAAGGLLFSNAALAAQYEFDKTHTNILFFVNHLGFSNTVGRFTGYDGGYSFDARHPEKSTIDVTLYPTSIVTQSAELDKKLQTEEFFNSAKFPSITFKSTHIRKLSDKQGEVVGDVTMLGVTKPVKLLVQFNKQGEHPYTKDFVTGFTAKGALKRSDFGMNNFIPMVGDTIQIHIEVEGIDIAKKSGEVKYNKKHR